MLTALFRSAILGFAQNVESIKNVSFHIRKTMLTSLYYKTKKIYKILKRIENLSVTGVAKTYWPFFMDETKYVMSILHICAYYFTGFLVLISFIFKYTFCFYAKITKHCIGLFNKIINVLHYKRTEWFTFWYPFIWRLRQLSSE